MFGMKFRLGTDNSGLETGLQRARWRIQSFASSAAGMIGGAFAAGFALNGLKNLFQEMDRAQKLGIRFGETAENIQKIGHVASLSGADVEMVAKSMTKLSIEANKEAAPLFEKLGIDAKEFLKLDMRGKLGLLADAHTRAGKDSSLQATLMELLGTRAGDLIPLLEEGRGIRMESNSLF
jgi:hypothetical protein